MADGRGHVRRDGIVGGANGFRISDSLKPKNRKKSSVGCVTERRSASYFLPKTFTQIVRSFDSCVWLWELGIGGCITVSQQSVDDITSLENTPSNVISVGEQHSDPLNHVYLSMSQIRVDCSLLEKIGMDWRF